MSKFAFELTGLTPLLMHADDIDQGDSLKAWRDDPANRNLSVPGDDRSPAWTWQAYLYHDGEFLACPGDSISAALRYAGARMKLKGNTTFKSLSQSGLLILDEHCELTNGGKRIALASLQKFRDEPYPVHVAEAEALGFSLFKKRCRPQSTGSKHVRVRARFEDWAIRGTIEILDKTINAQSLQMMFDLAGSLAGLMDWRPSSPKSPGPFGRFTAKLSPVK